MIFFKAVSYGGFAKEIFSSTAKTAPLPATTTL